MINCCNLPNAPEFCFRVPTNYLELLSMLPDSCSCASARTFIVDNSSNLLHAAPIKHDPYTPDSMDSPSPNAMVTAGEMSDVDIENVSGTSTSIANDQQLSKNSICVYRAVSPALLKSRLEVIIRNKKRQEASLLSSSSIPEKKTSDTKQCPTEYHQCTWSDSEKHQIDLKKNRSNSDISWQRSHIFTHTWLENKTQICHSVSDFQQSCCIENNGCCSTERIIPRIAIINASNFESNASSVHLHDDRNSNCLEHYSNTCSENRTKNISDNGFSQMKPEEFCRTINEESAKQSFSKDKNPIKVSQVGFLSDLSKMDICELHKTYYEPLTHSTNVIDKNCETYNQSDSSSELEVFKSNNKQEMLTLKTTTRSNLIQRQETIENIEPMNLKSKAYNKVTERYKQNITNKKERCSKCCCAVS